MNAFLLRGALYDFFLSFHRCTRRENGKKIKLKFPLELYANDESNNIEFICALKRVQSDEPACIGATSARLYLCLHLCNTHKIKGEQRKNAGLIDMREAKKKH